MKKLSILLLFSFSCLLNLYAVEKNDQPSAPVPSTEEYANSSLRSPHADLEVSLLTTGISQTNPAFKKIISDNESVAILFDDYISCLTSSRSAVSTIHSKDYLFFIYPSHNFW